MQKIINIALLKFFLSMLLLFCIASVTFCQSSPEVLYQQYRVAKTEADKKNVVNAYFESLRDHDLEPALRDLIKMHGYFKSEGDVSGIGTGLIGLFLAKLYEKTGNYSKGLTYALPALQNFENLNDTSKIIDALIQVGDIFTGSENIPQGLYYYNQCKPVIEAYHDKGKYPLLLNNIANCYNQINAADSALPIINTALSLVQKSKDSALSGRIYATLGNTHLATGDDTLARVYFNKGLGYLDNTEGEIRSIIYCGLAASFFKTADYYHVLEYSYNAAWNAEPNYKKELMQAYEWLYKVYEKAEERDIVYRDSVYKYFRLASTLKDSLFTVQKTQSQQQMFLQEQLRKEEIQSAKLKEVAERKKTISYILIGIGIIFLISLFSLLSQSFISNPKFIRGLGIIALLIVFEFFNLLLDPFLARVTGDSTLLMLLALVSIAAVLAPLHHRTEKWVINKLIEKNKTIRLARAKKTIELLEKENADGGNHA